MNPETRLFAYGTLKRGSPMHEQLCRGVRSVVGAQIWGRLYELPSGSPALTVPSSAILGVATMAPDEDHLRLHDTMHSPDVPPERDGWRPVRGQLISLSDFRSAWPTLDAWEDATPDRLRLFRRVIVRVERDNGVPITAWTYIVPQLPQGSRELMVGIWPAPVPLAAGE